MDDFIQQLEFHLGFGDEFLWDVLIFGQVKLLVALSIVVLDEILELMKGASDLSWISSLDISRW